MEQSTDAATNVENAPPVAGDGSSSSSVKALKRKHGEKETTKKKAKVDTSGSESSSSADEDDLDQQQAADNIGMFAAPNEPPTDHVDDKLRKKVKKGEFVELYKLYRKDAAQPPAQIFSLENGKLQLKDGNDKKITSFGMWLDCFIVFITIRGKKFPNEILGMLKHVETVKRLNLQGFDAFAYDTRFRHMKATYGGLPWGQYMPEIVSVAGKQGQYRGNPGNPGFASHNRNPTNNNQPGGFCRFFNAGSCFKGYACKFKHLCSKCQAPNHGAHQCKR